MFDGLLLGFVLGFLAGIWLMAGEINVMRGKVKDLEAFQKAIGK
jgi:hypothetical protein